MVLARTRVVHAGLFPWWLAVDAVHTRKGMGNGGVCGGLGAVSGATLTRPRSRHVSGAS
eukprot:CAMPEP_0174852522 /NCGR_PEP_ID=MMETSP1114-20130205/25712_1 /TAXON_ID=312471 /ORGANISM="Neobodo designis, Strain CCAP 1951/1" /LENGTH=58 /DNA_ID=CAMNT_0016087121 /DNA_START=111 /DNA_END=284 /DNA_ORIENTATION=+